MYNQRRYRNKNRYHKKEKKVMEKRSFVDDLHNSELTSCLTSAEFDWNNIREIKLR